MSLAEQNESQERTEQPTPKRLDDARKKGQIARSRELSTMLMLIGGAIVIYLSATFVISNISEIMRNNFSLGQRELFDTQIVAEHFMRDVLRGLFALSPILVFTNVALR